MSLLVETGASGATMLPVAALFLGDASLGDFRHVLAWLQRKTRLECTTLRAVLSQSLDPQLAPDWVVLGQSRDGEFSTRDIAELRRRWPLARCVVLAGSWVEGEQAKQKVCLGAWRAAWHQFVPRAAEQLAARESGRPGPWDRPLTLADDERTAAEIPSLQGLRIALLAERAEDCDDLAECLASAGAECRSELPTAGKVDAAVWIDRLPPGLADSAVVRECPSHVAHGLIVLTDFPRSGDWPQLLARPGGAVMGRPTSLADLAGLLRELTAPCIGASLSSPNLH